MKFIVVTHPQNKKSKRRRSYQQICSEKTDVWTFSNYQSVLLDMMTACAYMNSETLFF